ncbi:MAG: hypothetical protein QOK49_2196 [Baekduia sp.]|nr:hypothetical protein [Baekduia sp.]
MVVGRDPEIERVERFVTTARPAPGFLLLEGEAGIGKTTLWELGVAAARAAGWRVLTASPADGERGLAFAGLTDLLAEDADTVLPRLPEPQRDALGVALLLTAPRADPPDQRAVSVAAVGALRTLAADHPVVVAVDDVQWLDAPSAAALAFAGRRLPGEDVRLLLARRTGADGGLTLDDLPRVTPSDGPHRLRVGALDVHALHRLLAEQLGLMLPRPALLRLHRLCGGNPLFALELGRTLGGGPLPPGWPSAVPRTVQGVLEARLAGLDPSTARALRAAAALARPTTALVAAAMGRDRRDGARLLAGAVAAGIVVLDAETVRFGHPLLPTVHYDAAGADERRALHGRLAGVVTDPEERAVHLARALDAPDADAAAVIADAAARANARGAPAAAADLAEHARRLTPPTAVADRWRRTVDAADFALRAGDVPAARRLLDAALPVAPGPDDRAGTLARLALLCTYDGGLADARRLAERAEAEAEAGSRTLAIVHRRLSVVALVQAELGMAERHARAAARLAERLDDPWLAAQTTASLAFVGLLLGRVPRRDRLERALEPDGHDGAAAIDDDPRAVAALMDMYRGELPPARARLDACVRRAEERGDESHLAGLLFCLSELESRAGDFRRAQRLADRGISAAAETGQSVTQSVSLFAKGLAEAHLGEGDTARATATAGLQIARSAGQRWASAQNGWVLGRTALVLGDFGEAAARLGEVVEFLEAHGVREAGVVPAHGDLIEALASLDRGDEAAAVLERFERLRPAPWLRAVAGRERGRLLAAGGEHAAAQDALGASAVALGRLGLPFERARSLLALGQTLRRAKAKRAAREVLDEARTVFAGAGAAPWARRAEAELARIGGRGPATSQLTPTEQRVAERVAAGRSNKEVAAELFVTVRAVEANLSRVYAKLGVRSRTQLAAHLGGRGTSE